MEEKQEIKICPYCQSKINKKANVCPICKKTISFSIMRVIILLLIVILIFMLLSQIEFRTVIQLY